MISLNNQYRQEFIVAAAPWGCVGCIFNGCGYCGGLYCHGIANAGLIRYNFLFSNNTCFTTTQIKPVRKSRSAMVYVTDVKLI